MGALLDVGFDPAEVWTGGLLYPCRALFDPAEDQRYNESLHPGYPKSSLKSHNPISLCSIPYEPLLRFL